MDQQRRGRPTIRRDVDGAWKQIVRDLLPECIAFTLPDLHRAIDWSRAPEFLDKELQAIARRAATGRRHVDLLVKVWLRDGQERWLLIHVEVQGRTEEAFAERMFLYHALLFLHYRRPIVSLAILSDGQAGWRPSRYTYDHWGSAIDFRYPVVKILDWRGREAELSRDTNPIAQIMLAQLAVLTSRGRTAPLAEAYRAIVRQLYRAGYDQRYVSALLTFLDWVLAIPDEVIAAIDAEVAAQEGVNVKQLKSRWEARIEAEATTRGLEQGLDLGRRQLVQRQIERRCGPLDVPTREAIDQLPNEQIATLADALLDFAGRADLDRWLAARAR